MWVPFTLGERGARITPLGSHKPRTAVSAATSASIYKRRTSLKMQNTREWAAELSSHTLVKLCRRLGSRHGCSAPGFVCRADGPAPSGPAPVWDQPACRSHAASARLARSGSLARCRFACMSLTMLHGECIAARVAGHARPLHP